MFLKNKLFLFFLLFPCLAIYAQSAYFEFAPDLAKPIETLNREIYQTFISMEDNLSGFNLWIDNSREGNVLFQIYDSQNKIITSINKTIPVIPPFWQGNKIYIDLGTNISLKANEEYKIKIVNRNSNLRVYAIDLKQIITHQENLILPQNLGKLYIDNKETEFALKFSLFENSDQLPPIISNFKINILSATQTVFEFNTNEAVDYKLILGSEKEEQIVDFSGNFIYCLEGIFTCSINLSTQPSSSYAYQLFVKDSWGNQSNKEGTFTTPVISTNTENSSENKNLQEEHQNIKKEENITNNNKGGTQKTFITLEKKENKNEINISWKTSSQSNKGYKVRIINSKNQNIVKEIDLSSSTNKITLKQEEFRPDNYQVLVYSQEENNQLTLVDKPLEIKIEKTNSQKEKVKFYQKSIFGVLFLLTFATGIIFIITKLQRKTKNKGFTLIEITIGIFILVFIIFLIFLMIFNLSNFQIKTWWFLKNFQDVHFILANFKKELRAMRNSSLGSYPLEIASPTTIVFYSDIDGDNLAEKLRYFLEDNSLKRGVIKPSGDPLRYEPTNEKISLMLENIEPTSAIFYYYSENYTDEDSWLDYPIDISKIKTIKLEFKIKTKKEKQPETVKVIIAPRNLRFK